MGNEEKGISNAVMRSISNFCAFKPQGSIKSLNVSVASAVAMEKFFG
jgi:23S rRNA (guanosine2251-2'-O)-methyltransferase